MIDVLASSKPEEIDLVLHFVNKDLDPKQLPTIKKFTLTNDVSTKEFLRKFENLASVASHFYKK